MFDAPDRRFWYLFAPIVLVFILNDLIPNVTTERLLYVAIAAFGLATATIEIREGRCLNRPRITRDDSPFEFWADCLISIGLGTYGIYKLSSQL
jgi:hypothetical protein